jgi:putative transcriptional regulator
MAYRNAIRCLLLAVLMGASAFARAEDLTKAVVLVAKPELRDPLYGATVLVVAPLGRDRHVGFIVNRPTEVTLGKLFPSDSPAQKVIDPVYLGGPFSTEFIFALVQRADSPGAQSVELVPGLYAVVDANTVDHIIRTESDHARFVAGFVAWRPGELRHEIELGAWYVLEADAALALRKPQGLWEELVRNSRRAETAI